jgi:hypothetical protein
MTRFTFVFMALAAFLLAPSGARAQTPPSDLMQRLGAYAVRFETMRTHASYAVEGKLESIDGSSRVDSTKTMKAHVDADGRKVRFSILQYVEDGADKTGEAKDKQKKQEAEDANKPPSNKREWRMPFHPGEQARYYFDQVEVEARNPNRVRIAFSPKIKEDDTIEGSAWVDVSAGTLITAGFKLVKPPTLVEQVHVTMFFGEQTALGPAPSRIAVDARGGVLFVRKRYHAEATLSGYRLVP